MSLDGTLPESIGPYQVTRVLGRGAMSVVYHGSPAHPDGQPAAIKLLLVDTLADGERPGAIARFRREAQLCRQMDHPNVVRVFDTGDYRGNPFLAMELLDGQSLAEVLRGPRMAPPRAVELLIELLDALAHAHANQIIHRDIKPANMILRGDGHLTLVDFGIARQGGSDITQLGDMLGSPAYMAPEQIAGAAIDHRADLFSAGVVLYGLITRQRPFSGTVASVMQAILNDPALAPSHHDPSLPPAIDRLMERALAKKPDHRFQSAQEFANALRGILPQLAADNTAPPAPASAPAEAPGAETLRGQFAPRLARAHAAAGATVLAEQDIIWLERAEREWATDNLAVKAALETLLEDWPGALSRLSAVIVDTAPLPDARRALREDWMLLVRLAGVSMRLLNRLGHTSLARSHHRRLSDELSEPFIVYVDSVAKLLAQSENPDLDRLSMGLFRLDVLEMALEAISAHAELRLAQKTRMLVAIQAMRKVNEAVATYTRTRDMIARFDVALIMSEIEALISIAGRLTDESGAPAGRQLGETAQGEIRDFIGGAEELAQLIVEELREMDTAGEMRVFSAKLGQMRALYHFAARLPGQQHRAQMGRLAGAMHDQVDGLARHLMAMPNTDDALSEIYELADGVGWQALAAEILRHLQARSG